MADKKKRRDRMSPLSPVSIKLFKLSSLLLAATALIARQRQVDCSNQQQQNQQQFAIQPQHFQRFSNADLVNSLAPNVESPLPHFAARSLPLQQQQAVLDNVIESTTTMTSAFAARFQAGAPTCQFPPTWTGKWYQANREPIRVTNTEISDKGACRDKKGDKYLFEYSRLPNQPSCLICLVINERHLNVLQYKESSCQAIPLQYLNRTGGGSSQLIVDNDHTLLDSICSDITGDAQLESLFRLDTPAIECSINGKYNFNYDNCREPLSSLDSCIDKKHLNFKFAACPDVPGSESRSEVLKCYADWSEGNNYYMIGRLEHASNQQDKGKFRCFLYEKTQDGEYIQMSQSLEESCQGLTNANDGPRTLRLTARQQTSHKCHFPNYIQSHSENWLSVDNSLIYTFNQNSTKYQVKETKEGTVIEEATCLQQFAHSPPAAAQQHPHYFQQQQQHLHQTRSNGQQVVTAPPPQAQSQVSAAARRYAPSNFNQADQSTSLQSTTASKSAISDFVYLVQITKNCHTTDYCVRFHKRTSGIIQIDYFLALPSGESQRCRNAYYVPPQIQIITSTNLEHQKCPFEGAYSIEAPAESDYTYNPSNIFICPRQSFLTSQCEHQSRLRIHYKCSPSKFMMTKNLYCLGTWTANGLVRFLMVDDERQRYTAWYRDNQLAAGGHATELTAADTRSQQLRALSATAAAAAPTTTQQPLQQLPNTVDLQISLIIPATITKPMQVRLTKRQQCSDLRGYLGQQNNPFGVSSAISQLSSYPENSAYGSSSATSSSVWRGGHLQALIVIYSTILIMLHFANNRQELVAHSN